MADDAFARKFAELTEAFRAQLPERLAEMRKLAAAGEFDAVREIAHQLAGRGGTFGAPAITEAARAVEAAEAADIPVALAALAGVIKAEG